MFVESLGQRLALETDLVVLAALTRPGPAVALAHALSPDVILLGTWLGEPTGIELARRLRNEGAMPRLLMIAESSDTPYPAIAALRAGVRGWIAKDAPVEALVDAVRAVLRGEVWLTPSLLGPLLDTLLHEGDDLSDRLHTLSPRECEVLQCLVDGLDQSATARRLYLSVNTVRTHRQRVLAKLLVHSSLEAVAVARDCGLTPGAATSRAADSPQQSAKG